MARVSASCVERMSGKALQFTLLLRQASHGLR